MRSPESPLTGRCLCGEVRIQVTAPFESSGYCHCKRCQRRSGTTSTLTGIVAAGAYEIVAGAEHVRTWRPEDEGLPKSYCGLCGGHLFSGEPGGDGLVGVRLGTVDADPEVEPSWRQWTASAPSWDPIPEDGLRRFEGHRLR